MVQFRAHSDGKVLVPDEFVELPVGQQFVVTVEPVNSEGLDPKSAPDWLQTAQELSRQMPPDLPEDLAEQHDHYIHGLPKR